MTHKLFKALYNKIKYHLNLSCKTLVFIRSIDNSTFDTLVLKVLLPKEADVLTSTICVKFSNVSFKYINMLNELCEDHCSRSIVHNNFQTEYTCVPTWLSLKRFRLHKNIPNCEGLLYMSLFFCSGVGRKPDRHDAVLCTRADDITICTIQHVLSH